MTMSSHVRRVGVAEAKAQLPEILRTAPRRRTIIQRRGRDVAVVIGIDELRRLEEAAGGATTGARMLARLASWRDRTGGVEGFEPVRASIVPEGAFPVGGRSIEVRDALLLGTASVAGLGVASRNVAHLAGHGVPTLDPFA
jgi:prevent-host-death family protein